jgi:ADP-ribosylglycohydrolase
MTANRKAAVLGAFVADALSLGVHWVYNTGVIDKKFGRLEHYQDPLTSYHKGKRAGDFTHYGDQTMVLLESVSTTGAFDARRFAASWRSLFENYSGYYDQATKDTLANMDAGASLTASGSASDDLAGAARLAALIPTCSKDAQELLEASQAQTAITHNNETVIAAAAFFARIVFSVLNGRHPVAAMTSVLEDYFHASQIAPLIRAGLESRDGDTRAVISDFGQMCSVEAGLPGAVHLIARYSDDFKSAMVENVMAGGDSSARGMLAGMVLAAAHGMDAIPQAWITGLNAGPRILAWIDASDAPR